MGVSGKTIVVIEDEEDILDVVDYNLSRAGFAVACSSDGVAGLELVRSTRPALVVLDLMLPGMDGIEVCRRLRRDADTAAIPVIMLTAKGAESDIVGGLAAGADDYVTKPFSPSELVARVQAVLRRGGRAAAAASPAVADDRGGERVMVGPVTIDAGRHEVLVNGVRVRFTRTELGILHTLASSPGRVFSRDSLVRRAIGDDAWVTDRTIDVHVRAIRKKLGKCAIMVETVRGVGYRVVEPASAPGGAR